MDERLQFVARRLAGEAMSELRRESTTPDLGSDCVHSEMAQIPEQTAELMQV